MQRNMLLGIGKPKRKTKDDIVCNMCAKRKSSTWVQTTSFGIFNEICDIWLNSVQIATLQMIGDALLRTNFNTFSLTCRVMVRALAS